MSVNVWEVDGETNLVISNVADKAEAVLIEPTLGALMYIHSSDGQGNLWRAVVGAAPGTYSDDGGSFCGTVFIPTGGDGSSAWLRDYDAQINAVWYGADETGAIDSAVAINTAIIASNSAGGGDVVLPPPSSFWLTESTIVLLNGVNLIFLGRSHRDVVRNYIRPSSSVSVAVYVSELTGFGLQGINISMVDMAAGSIGISIRSSWWGDINNCHIVNIAEANSIGIKIWSEVSAGRGCYWSTYRNCTARGTDGTGWKFLGESVGAGRLTTQELNNCASFGCNIGWEFDYIGSGMIATNLNAETATSHGVAVNNMNAGRFLTLNSGEIVGNGGWGITGTGFVHTINMVYNNNTSGNTDSDVIQQIGGRLLTGNSAFWRSDFYQASFSELVLSVGDSINPNVSVARIESDGGAVTLTSSPQIEDPVDNRVQQLTLIGGSNAGNEITLVDGNGLRLKGNMVLTFESSITLIFTQTFADWVEISRT